MAKLEEKPRLELEVTLRLNEAEARFLEGLSVLDHKKLLEHIRQFVGTHYTEGRSSGGFDGKGFLSLMESIRDQLPAMLDRMDSVRGVFQGTHTAVKKD